MTGSGQKTRLQKITRYGDAGPWPKGRVITVDFQLEGQAFVALKGGPQYKFTPAISFLVNCETQQEVDELWEKLTAGGEEVACCTVNASLVQLDASLTHRLTLVRNNRQ